jgi:polyisoprenoid-binding protein YceI
MLKGLSLLAGWVAFVTPLALAQTSTWIPDKAHSDVAFSILHMSLANVHGHFGDIGGAIVINDSDITKSTVTVTTDVATVDTGVAPRDGDLKGANFFDVAQFPTATFVSTSVTKNTGGLVVAGNLTVHGVTKPVILQVNGPRGPVQGMDHKAHIGFSATTTINRTAFNIGLNFPAALVGDNVQLTIDLDLARQ